MITTILEKISNLRYSPEINRIYKGEVSKGVVNNLNSFSPFIVILQWF